MSSISTGCSVTAFNCLGTSAEVSTSRLESPFSAAAEAASFLLEATFWRLETRAGLVISLLFLLGGVVDVVSDDAVGDRGVRVGDVGLAGKAGFSTVFSGVTSGNTISIKKN